MLFLTWSTSTNKHYTTKSFLKVFLLLPTIHLKDLCRNAGVIFPRQSVTFSTCLHWHHNSDCGLITECWIRNLLFALYQLTLYCHRRSNICTLRAMSQSMTYVLIRFILIHCRHLPKIYQAFLMSATFNEDVQALKELVLHNPVRILLKQLDILSLAFFLLVVILMNQDLKCKCYSFIMFYTL